MSIIGDPILIGGGGCPHGEGTSVYQLTDGDNGMTWPVTAEEQVQS